MGLLIGEAMPPEEAGVLFEPRSGFGGIFLKFQEKLIFFAKFQNKISKRTIRASQLGVAKTEPKLNKNLV